MTFEFEVLGTPVPQGSMRAFLPKGWDRPIITSDNKKLKAWRAQVSQMAVLLWNHKPLPRTIPIKLFLTFYFLRPKSNKDVHKTTKPDVDKLCRAILDSLTGIVYEDDSQVIKAVIYKLYGDVERVEIDLETLETQGELLR